MRGEQHKWQIMFVSRQLLTAGPDPPRRKLTNLYLSLALSRKSILRNKRTILSIIFCTNGSKDPAIYYSRYNTYVLEMFNLDRIIFIAIKTHLSLSLCLSRLFLSILWIFFIGHVHFRTLVPIIHIVIVSRHFRHSLVVSRY